MKNSFTEGLKKAVAVFSAFLLTAVFAFFGCSDGNVETAQGFSVHYINVGEGDCSLIVFGDGKSMLIDSGENSLKNERAIKSFVNGYAQGKTDYLMLTHTDSDHTGNAAEIIRLYPPERAFLPVTDESIAELYQPYYGAFTALKDAGTETELSVAGREIVGKDYRVLFLSPNPFGTADSAYDNFYAEEEPTPTQINDLSPIIFLEYKGVRFVWTGDASYKQEKVALFNAKNLYACDLDGIDFLKAGHHGGESSTCEEFVSVLRPAFAVFSLAGDNIYGHPSTQVMERLYRHNPQCTVLRTDTQGSISVFVDGDGKITVKTDAD